MVNSPPVKTRSLPSEPALIVCVPSQTAVPPMARTPFCRLRPVAPEMASVAVGCTVIVPAVASAPPVQLIVAATLSDEPSAPPSVPPDTTSESTLPVATE